VRRYIGWDRIKVRKWGRNSCSNSGKNEKNNDKERGETNPRDIYEIIEVGFLNWNWELKNNSMLPTTTKDLPFLITSIRIGVYSSLLLLHYKSSHLLRLLSLQYLWASFICFHLLYFLWPYSLDVFNLPPGTISLPSPKTSEIHTQTSDLGSSFLSSEKLSLVFLMKLSNHEWYTALEPHTSILNL
jgi:hypothetical protein